jgi:hypothetical protein
VLLLLVAVSTTLLLLNACGGGKSGGSSGEPGTPAGTYTLTVTAQAPAYQPTQNLTLTVQ